MKFSTLARYASWFGLAAVASAGDVIKDNDNAALNNSLSWVSGGPPGSSDVGVWDSNYAYANQTLASTLGASMTWNGIRVASPATVPRIRNTGGAVLTLGSGGIDMSVATNNFEMFAALNVGATQTWDVASGRSLTLQGEVQGSGVTVTKSGTGTLILSSTLVNYSGGLNLNGGTLQSSPLSGAQVLSGPLTGTSPLEKSGAGSLTLSGNNAGFSGSISLSAGTLNLSNAGAPGTGNLITIAGGVLDNTSGASFTLPGNPAQNWNGDFAFTGSSSLNLGIGAITMTGNRTLTVNGNTLTIGGTLTGTGNLTKSGAGTLAIDSTGSSIGQMIISGGTLKLTGGDFTCGGTGSALDIGRGGNGAIEISGGSLTVNGTQYGLVMGESGTASWTQTDGAVSISAPSNMFVGNQAGGTTTMAISGGTFTQTSGSLLVFGVRANTSLTLSGSAEFNVAGLQFGHSSTGTTSNVVNLDGGKFSAWSVTRANGTATFNFNGGLFQAMTYSTNAMAGLTAANVRSGGARFDTNGFETTIAQPLLHDAALGSTPDGGLVVTDSFSGGRLILTGASTYTGPTMVQSGTLAFGPGGSIAASPVIDLAFDATLDAMTGASIASGQTLQGTGTLAGALTIAPGGVLSPAGTTIGTMPVTGSLILNGTAEFQINKAGSTKTADQASGASKITYGGTLHVTATGTAPALGDIFKLFDASSYAGSFSTLDLPALGTGLFWETATLTEDGTIKVINTLPTPNLSPGAGSYVGAQSVTISSASGSTIHYTLDGGDPTVPGPNVISAASPVPGVVVPGNVADFTIKAYATKSATASSPVVTAVYNTVANPVWTWDGSGNWSDPLNWLLELIPDGSGISADFSTLTLTSNSTVTLDFPRTIGQMKFGDVADVSLWTVAGTAGLSLTLDAGASSPVVDVVNQTTTIDATLAGTHGVTKTGAGTLVLSNPGTLSGDVLISQGMLRTGTIASGTIILGDANSGAAPVGWQFKGGTQPSNNVIVNNQGTGTVTLGTYTSGQFTGATGSLTLNRPVIINDQTGDRTTYSGKISGNVGSITITGPRVTFGNAANDFTGDLIVSAGSIYQNDNPTALPATTSLANSGTFRLNTGGTHALDAIDGPGAVNIVAGGNTTLSIGNSNGSGTIGGVISNGSATLTLIKNGNGIQTFAGANTYTGTTTVNGGSLLVTNTTGSGTGTGAVTVNTGAALGGTGAISGAVTVNTGATLAPGTDGTGTLATGALVLAGAYQCQVSGAVTDQLTVTGDLNLTGSSLAVSAVAATPGTYVIATYTGTRTGAFASVTSGYTVNYDTPNQVKLVVSGTGDAFATWVASYGLTGNNALAGADPEFDGLPNAVEFVVGGNPATVQDQSLLPTIALVTNPGGTVPNGDYMRFTYRRTPASAYLNPDMQYDADLTGVWTNATGAPGVVQVVTPGFFATPTPADKVDLYVPRAGTAVNGKLFGRLKVVNP